MNEDFIRKMRDEIKQHDHSFKVIDTYGLDYVLAIMAGIAIGLAILYFI